MKNEVKDEFYNKLDKAWYNLPGNVITLVLGDMNTKCGREPHYASIIGKENLHVISNRNGFISVK